MLKISKPLGARQAKSYYQNELSAQKEKSFVDKSLSAGNGKSAELGSVLEYDGTWHGKLAEEMNLHGAVRAEQFERLCDGRHFETGEQLVGRAPVRNYVSKNGKEITTMAHRAGLDVTFSAPKSVSLAAIVGGDERVFAAHRESVLSAFKELERYTEARLSGKNAPERTQKAIAALFEHDAARPAHLSGYAAPQLHTHAVVFNLTKTEDGRYKPLQPVELYRSQSYATQIYRSELAHKLQKLGYEIEVDRRTGAPEIKGFSPEYLKASSPRSFEVSEEAKNVGVRLGLSGEEIERNAGIKQIAAWSNRAGKDYDREEMKSRALELEIKFDFEAQRTVGRAIENTGYQVSADQLQRNAKSSLDLAKEMASLQIGFDERKFLTETLKNGIGKTSFEAVKSEYSSGSYYNELSKTNENKISLNQENEYSKSKESIREQKDFNNHRQAEKPSPQSKLSMDDLENVVRQKMIAEKEIEKSFELILAL